MTNDISVNKQSVLQYLTSGQEIPFLIPEYQRPYSWGDDEIITLFDDLWDFSIERLQEGGASSYFLGSVVSYYRKDVDKDRKIIDGQQRITSLCLLLRAIYTMLEKEEVKSKEVNNFIDKIQPALWRKDELSGDIDYKQMLLKSDVVSDSGNEILRKILETGATEKDATDNYSKNYNKFLQLYTDKSKSSPNHIFQFINALLNYTILLPINADEQETALTIFNTLNNRGLPLSDADIFKSHIYKGLDEAAKKEFIAKWKQLESDSAEVSESVQSLFYYHMFYLRAKENDVNTTTPGVRKYYLEKNKNRLTVEVIDDLIKNLHLWEVVNGRSEIDEEPWSKNMDIRKILDCLSSYTNEFWKYPASIFYMQYCNKEDFEELFLKFLRKLFVLLFTRFLEQPTVSAVKGDILKIDAQIIKTEHPEFTAGFEQRETSNEEERKAEEARINGLLIKPQRRVERMLLKLLAYQESDQINLLPAKWDIEHIFPQKWDSKYYTFSEKEANEKLEHIGNKLPLGKKQNISASNNYFSKKKEAYKKSDIAICQRFANSTLTEWDLNNITERDAIICDQVKKLFETWINDYEISAAFPECPIPTQEELEMMRKLRERGLI